MPERWCSLMAEVTDNMGQVMMAVGRLEGQVRELIHNSNSLAQKFEYLTRHVDQWTHIPLQIEELKASHSSLQERVVQLETIEHQRKGAMSLGSALMKIVPWLLPAGFGGAVMAMVAKILD